MDIKRCSNNHYYDSDKYVECPHCDKGLDAVSYEKKQEESDKPNVNPSGQISRKPKPEQTYSGGHTSDVADKDNTTQSFQDVADKDNTTQSFQDVTFSNVEHGEQTEESSLENLVQQTGAYENNEVQTISLFEGMNHIDPVVGWLVCVEGPAHGYAYELKTGKNYIGRNANMDICISDNTVSREKHAVLMFEPHRKEFSLLTVESKGVIYVNDENIKENTTIQEKDIITVGTTKLLFIPLCDDEFDWSNPVKINRKPATQENTYSETTVTSYRSFEPQTTVLTSTATDVQPNIEENEAWVCPICAVTNPASSEFCQMCGAPREK